MKNLSFLGIISLLIFSFYSCGGDTEVSPKNYTINGQTYNVTVALLDDWGTNNDITYRMYRVSFQSASYDPANYLEFVIYSNSTTRIEEGIYEYSYSTRRGVVSYIEIGKDIAYDDQGYRVSGEIISESNSTFEGTVTIGMNNGDYDFTFDLTAYKGNSTYRIGGQYNAPLSLQ